MGEPTYTKNGKKVGRPRSCECGDCKLCRRREVARAKYQALSVDERKAIIARRDRERVLANDRARHERQRDERVARMAEYQRTEAGRAAKARGISRYQEKYPEKKAATTAVNNAVRDGRLVRGECAMSNGGCDGRIHGHHEDYSKPLEVVWLCERHHKFVHQQQRAA